MKKLDIILATLIRDGAVTVDIPGIEHIEGACRQEAVRLLGRVEAAVFSDMADGEIVAYLRALLEE